MSRGKMSWGKMSWGKMSWGKMSPTPAYCLLKCDRCSSTLPDFERGDFERGILTICHRNRNVWELLNISLKYPLCIYESHVLSPQY